MFTHFLRYKVCDGTVIQRLGTEGRLDLTNEMKGYQDILGSILLIRRAEIACSKVPDRRGDTSRSFHAWATSAVDSDLDDEMADLSKGCLIEWRTFDLNGGQMSVLLGNLTN